MPTGDIKPNINTSSLFWTVSILTGWDIQKLEVAGGGNFGIVCQFCTVMWDIVKDLKRPCLKIE